MKTASSRRLVPGGSRAALPTYRRITLEKIADANFSPVDYGRIRLARRKARER